MEKAFYRLSDQDILGLYGYLTPTQIVDEFKPQRVRSAPAIYRLYSKFGLERPLRGKHILNILHSLDPIQDEEDTIQAETTKKVSEIWNSINEFENAWEIQ